MRRGAGRAPSPASTHRRRAAPAPPTTRPLQWRQELPHSASRSYPQSTTGLRELQKEVSAGRRPAAETLSGFQETVRGQEELFLSPCRLPSTRRLCAWAPPYPPTSLVLSPLQPGPWPAESVLCSPSPISSSSGRFF